MEEKFEDYLELSDAAGKLNVTVQELKYLLANGKLTAYAYSVEMRKYCPTDHDAIEAALALGSGKVKIVTFERDTLVDDSLPEVGLETIRVHKNKILRFGRPLIKQFEFSENYQTISLSGATFDLNDDQRCIIVEMVELAAKGVYEVKSSLLLSKLNSKYDAVDKVFRTTNNKLVDAFDALLESTRKGYYRLKVLEPHLR